MLFILGSSRLCGRLCLALVSELDALIDAPIYPLGIVLLLLFQPLSMVLVIRHVHPCAMMRAPLDSGARDGILRGLANLGVLPFVGWLFIAFLDRLVLVVVVSHSSILELLFESIHLGGQGNDLGVG